MKKNYFFLLISLFSIFYISAQSNLVPNGDMENWDSLDDNPTEWARFSTGIWKKSTDFQNGLASLELEINSGDTQNFIFSPNIAFTNGTTYVCTFYYKLVTGTFSKVNFNLVHKPGVWPEDLATNEFTNFPADTWVKGEFEFTATTTENIQVYIKTYGTEGAKILIDNVSVIDKKSTEIVNIPDANFKAYLTSNSEINTNNDDEIQFSEAQSFNGRIYLYGKNKPDNEKISDLTGVEAFINLTDLDCSYNLIKNIDVSKNSKLQSFSCSYNQLTDIDITNNLNLKNLQCYNNKLKVLDVSLNKNLNRLGCHYNEITSLDLTQNNLLESLSCAYNLLTQINLTHNTELQDLYVSNNTIKNLDLTQNLNLKRFSCQSNELTTLDVSKNSKLIWIWCQGNQITTLDVSKNLSLKDLRCYGNKITELNIGNNDILDYIDCSYNLIENLNVSGCSSLKKFYCNNNKLSILNLGDINLLTVFNCNKNVLQSLNISKNIELIEFYCKDNSLEVLDIDKNTKLQTVNCVNNAIKVLNTSQNQNLINFFCGNNEITSLDFSNNKSLKQVSCKANKLINLNIQNTANNNISFFHSHENPDLLCIQVDDETVAPNLNGWYKDSSATYSEDCSATASIDDVYTESINLHPNPVEDTLIIETQHNQPIKKIQIFNTLGKEIMITNQHHINCTSLPSGVYLIKIESTDQKTGLKKFIKL